MGRSTIRIQDLTKVTTLDDDDVIPIGRKSGDVAVGITKANMEAQFGSTTPTGFSISLNNKADVLANGTLLGDEITLNVADYYLGVVDLTGDVIKIPGGATIRGGTATLSSLTTSSVKPTITALAGAAASLQGGGGLLLNNTGTGAALHVNPNAIFFVSNLLTTAAGNGVELDGVGGFAIFNWTLTSGVTNAAVLTGTNPRLIFRDFNPSGCTGIGIDIQGPMSGPLLLELPLIDVVGIGIKCDQSIQGYGITDGLISSRGAKGIEFSGDTIGSIRASGARIAGNTLGTSDPGDGDAIDISGASTISTFVLDDSNVFALGAGNACIRSDTPATGNLGIGMVVSNTSIIAVAGATELVGISKKDLKVSFGKSSPITDSTSLGCFTLDSQAEAARTTIIGFQGFDGNITVFSDPGGGVNTTVDIGAHAFANGTPVSIQGTVAYNGLFTMANVTATEFDIVRTFVTAEVVGTFETGWTKVAGSTTDCDTIERYTSGANNNELEYLGSDTIPVIYNASISGEKSGGTVRTYEFALFCDSGSGFRKINGSIPLSTGNTPASANLRIPTESVTGEKATTFTRNMGGTEDYIGNSLTVDITFS